MAKYVVTVEADQNDADYISQSHTVDLDAQVFKNWVEPYNTLQITYLELLTALGNALKELGIKYRHDHNRWNWYENPHNSYKQEVLERAVELLDTTEILSPDCLESVLYEFIPGSYDYPIHTILNITALPAEGNITFF